MPPFILEVILEALKSLAVGLAGVVGSRTGEALWDKITSLFQKEEKRRIQEEKERRIREEKERKIQEEKERRIREEERRIREEERRIQEEERRIQEEKRRYLLFLCFGLSSLGLLSIAVVKYVLS
ncbi:MAG: hypothetical protein F6J93_16945 [Oscillatoria sp. SIO1A7]|nr:hypothetical protein [Oscillatoria sp. SIO1A7]